MDLLQFERDAKRLGLRVARAVAQAIAYEARHAAQRRPGAAPFECEVVERKPVVVDADLEHQVGALGIGLRRMKREHRRNTPAAHRAAGKRQRVNH